MIQNDQELRVMRERVAKIEKVLEALRATARPAEWPALSSGYRLEPVTSHPSTGSGQAQSRVTMFAEDGSASAFAHEDGATAGR